MANAFPFKSDCPVPSIDAITGSLVASCLVSSPPDPIFEFPNDFPVPPPPGFNFGCYEPSVRVRFQSATISTDPETSEQVILSQPSFGVNVLYPNRDETGLCQPVFEFLVRFPGIICYAPSTSVFLTQSTSYVDPSTGIIVIDSSPSFGVKITYPNFSETGVCEPTFNFLVRFPPAVCPEVSTDAQFTFNREYLDPLISLEGEKREGEEDKCAFDFKFSLDLPCASIEVMPEMSISFAPDERITYGLPYGSVSVSLLPSEPAEEGGKGPDVCKYKFDFFLNMPQQHPKYTITGEIPCTIDVDMNSCVLEASGSAFSWEYHTAGFSGGGIPRHPELDPTANADKNPGLPLNYKQRLWPPEELVWYPMVTSMDLHHIPASEVSWGFVEGTPAGCLQQPAEGYFLEYRVAWFRHPYLRWELKFGGGMEGGEEQVADIDLGEAFTVITNVYLAYQTIKNPSIENPIGCIDGGLAADSDRVLVAEYEHFRMSLPDFIITEFFDCEEDYRTPPCAEVDYVNWIDVAVKDVGNDRQQYELTYDLFCEFMPHVLDKQETADTIQLEHGGTFDAISAVEVSVDDEADGACDHSTNYQVKVTKRTFRMPEGGSGGIDFTPELWPIDDGEVTDCCTVISYVSDIIAFELEDKPGGGHFLKLTYTFRQFVLPEVVDGNRTYTNEDIACSNKKWTFPVITDVAVTNDMLCEPCGKRIDLTVTTYTITSPGVQASNITANSVLKPCDSAEEPRKIRVPTHHSITIKQKDDCDYYLEFETVEIVLPVLAKDMKELTGSPEEIKCLSGSWTLTIIDDIDVIDYDVGDCYNTGSRQLSVTKSVKNIMFPPPGPSIPNKDTKVVDSCDIELDVVVAPETGDLKLAISNSETYECGYGIQYKTRRIMLPTVKFIENTLPTPPNAGELAVISEIKMEANSDCSSNPLAKQLEVTWGVTDFGGYTGDVVIVCCVECPDEDLIVKCRKLTFAKGILMSRSEACDGGECATSGGDCP